MTAYDINCICSDYDRYESQSLAESINDLLSFTDATELEPMCRVNKALAEYLLIDEM